MRRIHVLAAVAALAVLLADAARADANTPTRRITPDSSAPNIHIFQNRSGTQTFTNRPKKYRYDRRYEEMDLDLKPIDLPKAYRLRKNPAEYTTENIRELVHRYARIYNLDSKLVFAVIEAESAFNPKAVSPAGACGLMQLMPGTAEEMNVTDIFDPAQNIAGGTQYLAKLLDLYKGNTRLALAGYNAGPGAVKKYGGIPPYKETQDYVQKVMRRVGGANGIKPPAPKVTYRRTKAAQRAIHNPAAQPRYTVHFHSGLTQPADAIREKDPYYFISYGNREFPIRKALVKRIED